ncbi:MAG: response regulator transcription factor, partial [Candidatus Competibacteraceae bacterium]|nr:response regulator transcription factor [Candidatus Competibacteraceae bacterium]
MKIRTILADDHEIFRQGLSSLLDVEPDIELVAQAANGQYAWELVETLKPDIAILDIGMPELSGIEIARKVEETGMNTRVVLLTMHDDPCTAADAQQAGASGYVLKDNSFEELLIA